MLDLVCRHVSKRYHLRGTRRDGGEAFWALRDVGFEVQRGEALGIIGANGAGKSTLLRLVSGITTPTEGVIVIHGRLSALIEVGSGFHPELSGRDNVFLNGAILGMTRRDIAAKFDRIVEFSGVGSFIDVPVKWYSSGMYVRLGFAVAAHLDSDILLIDEVLAVGDAAFQARCLDRVRELRRNGTTTIFISHDLHTVEQLCERALLLEQGRVVTSGAPGTVIRAYRQRTAADSPLSPPDTRRGAIALVEASIAPGDGEAETELRTGHPFRFRVAYAASAPTRGVTLETFFYSPDGKVLFWQQTTGLSERPLDLRPGSGSIEFACDELPLQPGRYATAACCRDAASQDVLAWRDGPIVEVRAGKSVRGYFYAPHRWEHHPT
jgi:ABC-type polysaccharide/polyol phosphate transport system ATPase subunit